jgi:hypothetical protein
VLKIVTHVLKIPTELPLQLVIVIMDIMKLPTKLTVKFVVKTVLLVSILPVTVSPVPVTWSYHLHALNQNQLLNPLKSLISQSDLLKLLFVDTDVLLVKLMLIIVLLVLQTEKVLLLVFVLMDTLKIPITMKLVIYVVTCVLHVLLLAIIVNTVPVTELHYQIVPVQILIIML